MFADYTYYRNDYLCNTAPTLDESSFMYFMRKAQQSIKRYTHGNINENTAVPDCVKLCCCELAEFLYKSEKSRPNPGVASETTGDVSVSYKTDDYDSAVEKGAKRIIYNYLADTGLLYGGVK